MSKAKDLDVSIDPKDTDDGLKQLLQEIKPVWKWNNVKQKVLSGGGYSCVILHCFDETSKDDSVTVRIINYVEFNKTQKKFEMNVLKHLCEIQVFPPLLATFNNGYCYKYIKGKPTANSTTGEVNLSDEVLKSVAENMARLHTIKPPGVDMKTPTLFHMLTDVLEKRNSELPTPHQCPSKEMFLNECSALQILIENLNTPVTLCHGDAHPGNVIWSDDCNAVFIDWELVHVGYQYLDIARFMHMGTTSYADILAMFGTSTKKNYIPKEMGNKFCLYYYEAMCRLQNKIFVASEYNSFRADVEKFKTLDVLTLLIFATQDKEDVPTTLNTIKLIQSSVDMYLQLKEKHFLINTFG